MEDLKNYLVGGREDISGDALKQMGLEASAGYLKKLGSLNNLIAKTAEDNSLNDYQIQRLCEFANNATFRVLFEKEASSKIIEFPVADCMSIVKIKTAARNPVVHESSEIHETWESHVPGTEGVECVAEALFGAPEPLEKEASVRDVYRMWQRVTGERDHIVSDLHVAEGHVKTSARKFYGAVRSYLLDDGGTLGEVLGAISDRENGQGMVKAAMSTLVCELQDEGILTKEAVGYQLTHRQRANEDHPVVNTFDTLVESAVAAKALKKTAKALTKQVDKLETAIAGTRC